MENGGGTGDSQEDGERFDWEGIENEQDRPHHRPETRPELLVVWVYVAEGMVQNPSVEDICG